MTHALGPSVSGSSVGATVDSVRKPKINVKAWLLTSYGTLYRAVYGRACAISLLD